VLDRRGAREVHKTTGGSGREFYTVLGTALADGSRLPPNTLYKGVNIYQHWTNYGTAGVMYDVSKSSWMEADNFLSWFSKVLLPAIGHHFQGDKGVVLFVDGHKSHLSLPLICLEKEKGVQLYCLPPLQPLDIVVYGPVKTLPKILDNNYVSSKTTPHFVRY
jgi:hypothetical protein